MPSKSPAQARLFAAVAHDPKFAAKVGIPQSVGKEFNSADAGTGILSRKAAGGSVNKGGADLAAKAYRLARSMAKEQEAASDEKDRHFDLGGTPEIPPFVKSEMIQMQRGNSHPPGLVQGAGPGRTDTVSTSVPSGSYVLPADVISGLGQGNSGYGADVMSRILSSGPHGITMPHMRGGHSNMPHPPAPYREPPIEIPSAPKGFAEGGEAEPIDVKLASGEFVLHPHQVKMFGGGDIDRGHRVLDKFVLAVRKKAIDEQKKLPGPKKSHEI